MRAEPVLNLLHGDQNDGGDADTVVAHVLALRRGRTDTILYRAVLAEGAVACVPSLTRRAQAARWRDFASRFVSTEDSTCSRDAVARPDARGQEYR